jgi:hypothetical protein
VASVAIDVGAVGELVGYAQWVLRPLPSITHYLARIAFYLALDKVGVLGTSAEAPPAPEREAPLGRVELPDSLRWTPASSSTPRVTVP